VGDPTHPSIIFGCEENHFAKTNKSSDALDLNALSTWPTALLLPVGQAQTEVRFDRHNVTGSALMAISTATDDRSSGRAPLDVVADKIIAFWKKSDDQRTAVAMLLKEAKERVASGEDKRFLTFKAWCHDLLPGRSDRDIRRLLQRAYAPDPVAEGERQRRAARDSTARTRARRRKDQRWSAAGSDEVVRAGLVPTALKQIPGNRSSCVVFI
jgi:hypothetical protein